MSSYTLYLPADPVGVRGTVTGLDLQRARHRLPDEGRALRDVADGDLRAGEGQQSECAPLLPLVHILARRLVRLYGAAAEQFGGSVVEVGAVAESITA